VLLLSRGLDGGAPAAGTTPLVGELAMVVACLAYASGAVFIRRFLNKPDLVPDGSGGRRALLPVETSLGQTVAAALFVSVAATVVEWLPAGGVSVPPSLPAWFAVTWLGVLGSALAYLLLFRVIRSWGATRTTLVTYIMPIVGIVLGVAVLQEVLDLRTFVGTAVIIAGVAIVNSRMGQRRLYGRGPATAAAPK
jgi:drug/metabolite transporter (DMT)-like permease